MAEKRKRIENGIFRLSAAIKENHKLNKDVINSL